MNLTTILENQELREHLELIDKLPNGISKEVNKAIFIFSNTLINILKNGLEHGGVNREFIINIPAILNILKQEYVLGFKEDNLNQSASGRYINNGDHINVSLHLVVSDEFFEDPTKILKISGIISTKKYQKQTLIKGDDKNSGISDGVVNENFIQNYKTLEISFYGAKLELHLFLYKQI